MNILKKTYKRDKALKALKKNKGRFKNKYNRLLLAKRIEEVRQNELNLNLGHW